MTKKIHAISSGYTLACNRNVDWLWMLTSNNLSEVNCKKCLAIPTHRLSLKTRNY